ncbi:MAG: hypothetical protein OXD36_02440 [Rhodobacter sp.]|nr:hypothetical protein [Rhodobacter sp.]MCY4240583.1 hypothetical protein [Rhodobacter sp.]
MPVRWNYWSGHVPEIIPTLRRSLGAHARNARKFKVGLSKDPEHRWHHYRNEKHRRRPWQILKWRCRELRYPTWLHAV